MQEISSYFDENNYKGFTSEFLKIYSIKERMMKNGNRKKY